MKRPLIATLALALAVLAGDRTGQPAVDLTEYDAVSADGPYSYLPTPGHGAAPTDIAALADLDGDPEIVTEEEARMTGLLLDVLAGDPTQPIPVQPPLDQTAPSDSPLIMAGL